MNINMVDINKMALNMDKMNKKLEYLIKQVEKGKAKYPLNITYDQLYENISLAVENGKIKEYKIVRIS